MNKFIAICATSILFATGAVAQVDTSNKLPGQPNPTQGTTGTGPTADPTVKPGDGGISSKVQRESPTTKGGSTDNPVNTEPPTNDKADQAIKDKTGVIGGKS
jgi:hypothetical protein